MMKVFAFVMVLGVLSLGVAVQADVLNLGSGFTSLQTVIVGDPGNAGELSGAGVGEPRTCGAVSYKYSISRYEVTAKQYTEFLNAKAQLDTYGLYNTAMGIVSGSAGCNIQRSGVSGSYSYSIAADWANRPVNYVSFWDSCRFTNWLNNGQGDGDTETGAYTLGGYKGNEGSAITRNSGAMWFLPTEDEWYKAAFYKGGGTNAGYWDYATQSDSVPSNDLINPDGGNNANFYQSGFTIQDPYYRTNVGEFENSESAYGTFDQDGNVWEWNETVARVVPGYGYRSMRGGGANSPSAYLNAQDRSYDYPSIELYNTGFRVASTVPEPPALILAFSGGLISFLGLKRRKRKA